MADKPKPIRSVNDLIIGIALFLLGVYILFTKHVMQGTADTGAGGILVRPDVYVRVIGGGIALFSLILSLKAINFKKSERTTGFKFAMNKEVAFTVAALILYVFLLPLITFFPSTFLLLFFLNFIYMRKEIGDEPTEEKPGRKTAARRAAVAAVYSVLLTILVYVVFSYVLKVALP